MKTNSILILLSTYNGEQYLVEQLDSIIEQTYTDWRLLIRDDGSSDKTLSIISAYCKKDQRIQHYQDELGNVGYKKSFSILMEQALKSDADYFAFCDQDDIWKVEKLQRYVDYIKGINKEEQRSPFLIFNNAEILDMFSNQRINYFQFKQYRSKYNDLKKLIFGSPIMGCFILFNRPLLKIAYNPPVFFPSHDWWVVIAASAFGHLFYEEHVSQIYRQHSHNTSGYLLKWPRVFSPLLAMISAYKRFDLIQQTALYWSANTELTGAHQEFLSELVAIKEAGFMQKLLFFRKYQLVFSHLNYLLIALTGLYKRISQ